MKYSGDKTLEHILFEDNEVFHIVDANVTVVEWAMRGFPNSFGPHTFLHTARAHNPFFAFEEPRAHAIPGRE